MNNEKDLAVILHILNIFIPLVGPLIIWLIYKDKSAFIDAHGKEAINFGISTWIYSTVVGILCSILIGILLVPVLIVLVFLFPILSAVKASKGEVYSSPVTIKILK